MEEDLNHMTSPLATPGLTTRGNPTIADLLLMMTGGKGKGATMIGLELMMNEEKGPGTKEPATMKGLKREHMMGKEMPVFILHSIEKVTEEKAKGWKILESEQKEQATMITTVKASQEAESGMIGNHTEIGTEANRQLIQTLTHPQKGDQETSTIPKKRHSKSVLKQDLSEDTKHRERKEMISIVLDKCHR